MENLKEGIWTIRKIRDGKHWKFEGEKIEDLPEIMTRATFEPYRNKIYQKLVKRENFHGIDLDAKEVIDIIFSCIRKK